jgi:hypothetical protein
MKNYLIKSKAEELCYCHVFEEHCTRRKHPQSFIKSDTVKNYNYARNVCMHSVLK